MPFCPLVRMVGGIVGAEAWRDCTPKQTGRSFRDACLNLPVHSRAQIVAGEWTEFRLVPLWVTHSDSTHVFREKFLEVATNLLDNNESLGGDAALSRIHQPPLGADPRRKIKIRIFQHEVGVAAPKFEYGLLERRAGLARDGATSGPLPVRVAARTSLCAITACTWEDSIISVRNRFRGKPASWKIASIATAHPGTFDACFKTAALAAIKLVPRHSDFDSLVVCG
jgi:hypothetical protein